MIIFKKYNIFILFLSEIFKIYISYWFNSKCSFLELFSVFSTHQFHGSVFLIINKLYALKNKCIKTYYYFKCIEKQFLMIHLWKIMIFKSSYNNCIIKGLKMYVFDFNFTFFLNLNLKFLMYNVELNF